MKWMLSEGIEICSALKPMLEPFGYCIGLTGSVLFKGESENDLDLILYPLRDYSTSPYMPALNKVLEYFDGHGAEAVTNGSDQKRVIKFYTPEKRGVDIFLMHVKNSMADDPFKNGNPKYK